MKSDFSNLYEQDDSKGYCGPEVAWLYIKSFIVGISVNAEGLGNVDCILAFADKSGWMGWYSRRDQLCVAWTELGM